MTYSSEDVVNKIKDLLTGRMEPGEIETDRQLLWQDFFLSDAFLAVHDKETFMGELVRALSAARELLLTRLEPIFLSELTLVYGIINFNDVRDYDKGNKGVLGNLLLEQDDTEWSEFGQKAQRMSRGYSYYSFRRICRIAQDGGLTDYNQEEWGNLSFYADDNYCPDLSEEAPQDWQLRLEKVVEPYTPAMVGMHQYLVRHYEISRQVCYAMRNNFEIDGRLGGYLFGSYQAVFEQMCQKYPDMEHSRETGLTDWKIRLLAEEPESPEFFDRVSDAGVTGWMAQVWKLRPCSSKTTQAAYDAYKEAGDGACLLLERLIARLVWYRNQSVDSSMSADSLEISLQNPDFWQYFLESAYPFTNDGRERQESDYHFALSAYMEKVYPVSDYFKRHFFQKQMQCDKDSMHYFLQAGNNGVTLSFDGKEVHLVFTPHHVEYTVQGRPVFYQVLPFAGLSALPESEEGNLTFFLLLPITRVCTDVKCREEIRRRLQALPFYAPTREYLADCLVRNTDWELQPDQPQKVFEEVYYSEDTWHCFRGRLSARKLEVEYKTPKGWHPMKLLQGESKNTRAVGDKTERLRMMHEVVDHFLPPEPKEYAWADVTKMKLFQKAEMVYDAMLKSHNLLGTNFTVTLWFREGDIRVPRLCYMYMEPFWHPAELLLEIKGARKNAYLNKEERLKRAVSEPVKVIGFFRVEMEHTLPFPVGVGESGCFYSYIGHRLVSAGNYAGLIEHCIDLKDLDKIEIHEGLRTVDLFSGKLQNWYMHRYVRETKEYEQNYPAEAYRELFREV